MILPRPRYLAFVLLAAFPLSGASAPPDKNQPRPVTRGCPPERAQDGEVRLVFLGDSGYGSGFSEWGTHGQEAVAAQIEKLRLAPDRVFFLGDNVYWRGAASLYKARFDDVYEPLVRECKAHVALGNHDVKGCRAVGEYGRWESCLQDLQASLVADRKARYMRQGMDEQAATAKAEADTAKEAKDVTEDAREEWKANCLPGDATAYEHIVAKRETCNATSALAHAQFGFGSVQKGDPPATERQRYYSILWPLPRLTKRGTPTEPPEVTTRPLVDVIVLDSNTLRVAGGMLEGPGKTPRRDELQLLWLRNAMSQWLPAPGEKHRIWKILAMHHPPYTPRSCACKIGKCIGGHGDEPLLQKQLSEALEDLEPPDLVMTAHNHIYARSHPLDGGGLPVADPEKRGIRYFVTGGGGAPLYAVDRPDARFAKSLTIYHFVYFRLTTTAAFYWTLDSGGRVRDSGCFEKGSGVDHPLAADFSYDDPLPVRCTPVED
jgi:hypothetical protein